MSKIDDRAYAYAKKHNLLRDGVLDPSYIRENIPDNLDFPYWFGNCIATEGETFANLLEFPIDIVMRVCRDSSDHSLRIGELIYRSSYDPVDRPVLVITGYYGGWLEEDEANQALQGAHFEHTDYVLTQTTTAFEGMV